MDKVMELYVQSMVALQTPRKGQGLVEYALILGLISLVLVAALGLLGTDISELFARLGAQMDAIKP